MWHMKHYKEGEKNGLSYPRLVKKLLIQFGVYQSEVEDGMSVKTDLSLFDNIHWKYEAERGWINTRMGTSPSRAPVPLLAEPLNELTVKQEEGTPELLAPLKGTTDKMEGLTSKVEKLEVLGDKFLKGSDYEWVMDMSKTAAKIEAMPTTLKEVEDSVNINLTHCTQIKEEMIELNRQLRFVATEVVGQLKRFLKS